MLMPILLFYARLNGEEDMMATLQRRPANASHVRLPAGHLILQQLPREFGVYFNYQ